MLGEVRRCAEVRRTVQPLDEPFDHDLGAQLEAADAREDVRVEELGSRGDDRAHCFTPTTSERWTRGLRGFNGFPRMCLWSTTLEDLCAGQPRGPIRENPLNPRDPRDQRSEWPEASIMNRLH